LRVPTGHDTLGTHRLLLPSHAWSLSAIPSSTPQPARARRAIASRRADLASFFFSFLFLHLPSHRSSFASRRPFLFLSALRGPGPGRVEMKKGVMG
jgi:hypothetical protein